MEKVNKRDFIKYVAKKNNIPEKVFTECYEAMIDGIMDMMIDGKKVSFTRFGAFYLQKHKGHPVQFESDGSDIQDYVVFKFSASDTMNQRLRDVCDVDDFNKGDSDSDTDPASDKTYVAIHGFDNMHELIKK